ncbi:hypothetical protein HWB05_gp088 [Streptomyces phage BRock]|uniref:Uncharacterized protein n=1 Tax=Streptomyces phage BRock TaxID=1913591 RepID=A0A1J0GW00_9CAUD|nr:hypothetical protein HWB05_gp088 [Streptomyces phage BRock]APC46350.1 hypothetical protein [Streptomyces phage BRock]
MNWESSEEKRQQSIIWRSYLTSTESIDQAFSKVFPGSTTPLDIDSIRQAQSDESDRWDDKPQIFTLKGKEVEFFTIGALARALGNRSPNTLRAWEKEGTLPKSPYKKPSSDPRGVRRMYSRAMVEGLIRIAKEEGVLWPHKGRRLVETQFTTRATELFRTLNRAS